MLVANESIGEILFLQQIFQVVLSEEVIIKIILPMFLSLFFIYLNIIMVYTLWSKPVFKETPRYILFAHMLLNDSIQLLFSSLLLIFSLSLLKLVTAACAFIVFVSGTTSCNAPLNLAAMSLERYLAVCFPLKHVQIATQRRTYVAIGIIWFITSVNFIIDMLNIIVIDPNYLSSQIICKRVTLFVTQWQNDVYHKVGIIFFVLVSMIILFTYISILITARSISCNKDSAIRAHKTVLLHLIQLGLCLTSYLYNIIEQAASMIGSSKLFADLRYLNYLFVLVLPRCLSPLIYGLRDDSLRPLFMYYFLCATGKHKPTVKVY